MPDKNEFKQVFAKLKAIFKPYAKRMEVAQDTNGSYLLNTRHLMKTKQPLCFGGVRLGVDEKLFKELAKLTKVGAARFNDEKFVDGLRKMQQSGNS